MKTEINKSNINVKELFSNEKAIISIIKYAFSNNSKIIVSEETNNVYVINYLGNYKPLGIKHIGDVYYVETSSLQKVNSNLTGRLKLKLIESESNFVLECTSVGFEGVFTDNLKGDITTAVSLYFNTGNYDVSYIESEEKKVQNKSLLNACKRNIWGIVCIILVVMFVMVTLAGSEELFEIALVFVVFALIAGFALTKSVLKSWINKGFISCD